MVNTISLKVAVVGVGGWGKNHARVLKDLGCLSAICDLEPARAREIAAKHGVKSYSSLDEMLDKERLDGCLVCTPTKTHAIIAKKTYSLFFRYLVLLEKLHHGWRKILQITEWMKTQGTNCYFRKE